MVNYKGRTDQIALVMEYVTAENYADMCSRVRSLGTRDTTVGSNIVGRFMELLGSGNAGWIDEINNILDGF